MISRFCNLLETFAIYKEIKALILYHASSVPPFLLPLIKMETTSPKFFFSTDLRVCLSFFILIVCTHAVEVSHDGRAITIDGQRRLLISGSIHYTRSTATVSKRQREMILIFYLSYQKLLVIV